MSRHILFQDISNTSHHAPKRKCETENFCAIATILRLLFFNPEMKCMQHLIDIFAIICYFTIFNTFVHVFSPISLFIMFAMMFFL
jgi:hypothetical protein